MRPNRHDTWQLFCDDYRDVLAETGMPANVVQSEHRFRDLMESGQVDVHGTPMLLQELPAQGWAALYAFAAVFFHEFESYAPEDLFPAFRREVERRGDEFPRKPTERSRWPRRPDITS